MRIVFTTFLLFTLFAARSQKESFDQLLAKGKAEFDKDLDQRNYAFAVECLEQAVKLKPKSAEAHYFLGSAYSRLNSYDGTTIPKMDISLVIKCSKEFETVSRLEPKYKGQKLLLDPYSKIRSEWASLAMSYWNKGKTDSMTYALMQGKQRGAFAGFYTAVAKNMLDDCAPGAILISSGDNITMSLFYVQMAEGYRNDVTVIDVSLLGTSWYPKTLVEKGKAQFDVSGNLLDTMEYMEWSDSVITIENFSWTLKPSYRDRYILRGDRVLLSLLRQNKFKREIYFTTAFAVEDQLSLNKYFRPLILVDQLNINGRTGLSDEEYQIEITKVMSLARFTNGNSPDETEVIYNFRYDVMRRTIDLINAGNKKKAKELLDLMDKMLPVKVYPYTSKKGADYVAYLRKQLK